MARQPVKVDSLSDDEDTQTVSGMSAETLVLGGALAQRTIIPDTAKKVEDMPLKPNAKAKGALKRPAAAFATPSAKCGKTSGTSMGTDSKDTKATSMGTDSKDTKAISTGTSAKYILMCYKNHGKNGTWAIRMKNGKQLCEVNVPGASLEDNKEIASVVLHELNEKGVTQEAALALVSMLKSSMTDKIAAGSGAKSASG